MVLVDTSVWVAHLRTGRVGLEMLLNEGQAMVHCFVLGELARGNLRNRTEILSLLGALPMALHADHEEVMRLIDRHRLMGRGLGYVDVHLLASALLGATPLWTLDKNLRSASEKLGLHYEPLSQQ
ncbi:MAG: PIN domain-containing protein [bacterium]